MTSLARCRSGLEGRPGRVPRVWFSGALVWLFAACGDAPETAVELEVRYREQPSALELRGQVMEGASFGPSRLTIPDTYPADAGGRTLVILLDPALAGESLRIEAEGLGSDGVPFARGTASVEVRAGQRVQASLWLETLETYLPEPPPAPGLDGGLSGVDAAGGESAPSLPESPNRGPVDGNGAEAGAGETVDGGSAEPASPPGDAGSDGDPAGPQDGESAPPAGMGERDAGAGEVDAAAPPASDAGQADATSPPASGDTDAGVEADAGPSGVPDAGGRDDEDDEDEDDDDDDDRDEEEDDRGGGRDAGGNGPGDRPCELVCEGIGLNCVLEGIFGCL